MRTLLPVLACLLCACAAQDSLDARMYEDMLMQDLYKRLSLLEDSYYGDDDGQLTDDAISLDSRGDGEAALRDSEYIEHGPNGGSKGFIHMSGGAGEGKQHLTPEGTQENRQEVKSDEGLPYYCHPPNPCPKGYTPTNDECLDGSMFRDTADNQKAWIESMMRQGLCNCDDEHMFDCDQQYGEQQQVEDEVEEEVEAERLNDLLSSILVNQDQNNNPYLTEDKRLTVVAKKSPRIKRNVDSEIAKMKSVLEKRAKNNPYLQGPKLRTAAKKGLGYQ